MPAPIPDPTHHAIVPVPLAAIDAAALARDRGALDPQALEELKTSIRASGLRMPIEVYALGEPCGEVRFGLISGFRRLAAFRALADWGLPGYDSVPAFLRDPGSVAEAMKAMVEENAVRAEVSPWEQALVAVTARDRGVFDTVEAAIDDLYASLSRDKRKRLRAVAHLAEDFDGCLTAPETLSLRQLLRLAAAASRGYAEVMRHALAESRSKEPDCQQRLLLPILAECEDPTIPDPRPAAGRRDRPRRTCALSTHRIRIRRELTEDGWRLHFTGKDATGMLIDRVFDEIELMFSPG